MKFGLKAAAAAAAMMVSPSVAQASTIMITSTGFDTSGYRSGSITYTPTSYTLNNVGIGRFLLSGTDMATMTPVQFMTYCVNIFNTLGNGVYTMPGLASYIPTSIQRQQLLTFLSNADPLIAAATTANARRDASAAVQLGVWEIVYEGSGTFNLGGGHFSVSGSNSAAARTLANGWLTNVTNNSWQAVPATSVGFLFNAQSQSQVFVDKVPEPATWAMLILGFGFVGAAMRRNGKRRNSTVVFA